MTGQRQRQLYRAGIERRRVHELSRVPKVHGCGGHLVENRGAVKAQGRPLLVEAEPIVAATVEMLPRRGQAGEQQSRVGGRIGGAG